MVTVLKMFRWLSISFGQGCFLQEPVLIFEIAFQQKGQSCQYLEATRKVIGGWTVESFLAEARELAVWAQALQLEWDLRLSLAPPWVPVDHLSSWRPISSFVKWGYMRIWWRKAGKTSGPVPRAYLKCSVNVNDYSVFNVDLKKREECWVFHSSFPPEFH